MSELTGDLRNYGSERYALSGKIMLSAIVILFTVVILIICLHIYARWFLARSRRRQQHLRNRRRRAHIIFTSDMPSTTHSHGLDASLLKSLPTFVFSSNTHEELLECAVCLSEFVENEKGRLLPKCNHSFHTACIDMWFHSHSTCPLCRSAVVSPDVTEPEKENTQIEIVIDSTNSQPNSDSTHTILSGQGEEQMDSSSSTSSSSNSSNSTQNLSLGSRRKALEIVGVSIEVPRRNESFKSLEEEIQGGQVFKSPGGRILSFKRLMIRDRRPSTPMSCSSAIETDLERGEIEEQGAGGASPPLNHQHLDQTTTSFSA